MSRILLRDLTPGTPYIIQLRTNGGDNVSQWSRQFAVTTTSDTIPPDVPAWAASNEWVVNGDTFVATWQPLNFTLSQNQDFKNYEIELTNGTISVVLRTTNTSYTLTFDSNRIFFGSPAANVLARVRSVDAVGNVSAWSPQKTATNPAPSPVNSITTTSMYDFIDVKWDAGTLPDDFKNFILQVSTTSSSTGFSTVYTGTNSAYQHASTMFATDHWFRVFVQDKFGTLSTGVTSGAVRPKTTFTIDTTPPGNPTGVAITQGFDMTKQYAWLNIAWTAPSDTDIDRYEVRWSTNGTNWTYASAGKDATSYRIENLLPSTSYYVDVRAVDYSTNVSSWVNQPANYPTTTNTDSTAPSQPAAPTASVGTMKIQVSVSGLKASGGNMEADVDYYEVYASTSSTFTTYNSTTMLGTIQKGPAMVETFNIPASSSTPSATSENWYVKVIAVDRSGNESPASPVSAAAAVGLILTANIADAQITNAKINSLDVNKLTAGTGFVNDLTVKSKFTLGDASTDGIIESYDYGTSSGATGFRLAKSGLIIKTGSIEAAALKIQQGNNLLNPDYASIEYQPSYYLPGTTQDKFFADSANTTVDIGTDVGKFGQQYLKYRNSAVTAPTGTPAVYFSDSATNDATNMKFNRFESSNTYIVSGYFRNPTAAACTVSLLFRSLDSSNSPTDVTVFTYTNLSAGSDWTRLYGTITLPSSYATGTFILRTNTTTTGAGFDFDGFQVEKKIANSDLPSTWAPPGVTSIDGGIIRTGEIRSSADPLVINGVSMPVWSIDTAGTAQFGNLLIRGNTIVGADDAEGADSYIKSYNYTAGNAGWIVRSDGYAEFRNVVIDGSGVEPGTLSAGAITSGTVLAADVQVTGALHTTGSLGEDISLDGEGFHVYGPYQAPAISVSRTSNVVTVTTGIPHGFSVVDSNTGQTHDVVMSGVAFDDTFNGRFPLTAVPSSTTFSYSLPGSDVSSTTVSAVAASMSSDAFIQRVALIDFPTDGTRPNIVSGTLSADTLNVGSGSVLRGLQSLENNSILRINQGVENPKIAPSASNVWPSINLAFSSSVHGSIYGVTKGYNGNLFVVSQTSSRYYILEFNINTGAYVATRKSIARSTSNTTSIFGQKYTTTHDYTVYGIAYNPINGVYNVAVKHIQNSELIDNYRYDEIYTYDSSWVDISGGSSYAAKSDQYNDAGWGADGLGWDYVSNKPLLLQDTGSNVTLTPLNIDSAGIPTSNASTLTLASTSNSNSPRFIARINSLDGGSADRYYFKNAYYDSSDAYTQNFIPYTYATSGTLTANTSEWWKAANLTSVSAAYYDPATGRINSISSSGTTISEYAGGDSYWSDTGSATTKSTWVGNSWSETTGTTFTVTNKARTGTSTTLTISGTHSMVAGEGIMVSGVDAALDGYWTISSVTSNTVVYNTVASGTITSTSASGTILGPLHETSLSPIKNILAEKRARLNVTLGSAIPSGTGSEVPDKANIYMARGTSQPSLSLPVSTLWHLRETIIAPTMAINIDPYSNTTGRQPLATGSSQFAAVATPAQIVSSTGNSFWKGDDTAQFYSLVLKGTTDVNTSAGNMPPLRIGDITAGHMRVDGNEIQAMSSNTAVGTILLNAGGGDVSLITGGTGDIYLGTSSGTNNSVYIRGSYVSMPNIATGSFTANMNWNSTAGSIRVNTSSQRFKENIKDAEINLDNIIALKPRMFQRNDERDPVTDEMIGYSPNNPWYVGFIAEEARDLGLDYWVVKDGNGAPFSFAYDYWVVAHQAVLRKHNDEILALKAEIEQLKNPSAPT